MLQVLQFYALHINTINGVKRKAGELVSHCFIYIYYIILLLSNNQLSAFVTCYSYFEKYSGLFFVSVTLRKEGARSQSIHKVLRGAYYVFLCNIVTRGYYLIKTMS